MTTTAEAAGLPFEEAIRFFLGKTNVPTRTWRDLWRDQHVRAWSVAGATSEALLNDIREEVRKALEEGSTLDDFRARFGDIVKKHGWAHTGTVGRRARIIYQTNLAMAYSAGRYAQMSDPDVLAIYPYWQYVHSGASHPRRQHLAWNGKVLRADDPFWNYAYPPNGWGCGCRVKPVSERQLARTGRAGPDQAPELDRWTETDPRTGRTREMTEGIDPGFDYNPGRAWLRPVDIPADVAARMPAPPPGPGVPIADEAASSLGALDGRLREAYRPWAEGLTEAERRALMRYKGADAFLMNERLRGGNALSRLDAPIRDAGRALGRARLDRPLTLYRAEQAGGPLDRAAIGEVVSIENFASFSIDAAGAAQRFADGVVIAIEARPGTPGAYLSAISRLAPDDEYEFLLPPRRRIRILRRIGNRIEAEFVDGD